MLDSTLRVPLGAKILDDQAPTLIITGESAPAGREKALRDAGATVVRVAGDRDGLALDAVMNQLAAMEINEVMVEAGPILNGALLEAGLLDEIVIYRAPHALGAAARPMFESPPVTDMADRRDYRQVATRRIGEDWRTRFVHGSV